MALRKPIQGIFAPLPTNFDSDGRVDRRAIAANVRRLGQSSLAGVLTLGSNGEAMLLEDDEADAVLAAAREALPADKVLLAGTGRESTRATIEASKRAASMGADVALIRTPSAFKAQMTPDALIAYYSAVADASPLPVFLYNLPGSNGVTITLPVVTKLAEHPNIIGMKETSPELERLGQFVAVKPASFRVMTGWAPVLFPALMSGAAGGILAISNVVPDTCVAIFDLQRAGRHAEALALQQQITPLAMMVSSIYHVAGLKAALEIAGFNGGPVRSPLLPVTPKVRDEIAAAHARLQEATRATMMSR